MRQSLLSFAFLMAVLCTGSITLWSQTANTGKLTGTVTDPSGAVVPNATLKLTNPDTGEVRTAVTDQQGVYNILLLQPGNYSLEVTSSGLQTATLPHIVISVSETTTLPIQMTVGQASQSITVTSAPELLQTDSSATGQVVEHQQVESLPLVARNFTQILALSANVNMSATNATDIGRGSQSSESATNGGKSVHGSRPDDNNFEINGIQVNDQFGAGEVSGAGADFGGGLPIPNPDTIQEFKVQTSQFDASYGRNAGGQINIVTRGGTNDLHGSLFEFLRNEDLNANDFFRNLAGEPRGLLRQNQYGGTIGGPIIHDRLYYFGSYQGTRQLNGVAVGCAASVFSPPLTNDRSAAALGAMFGGQSGAFGGVAVAPNGSNISPVALELLNFKLPNGQYLIPTPQTIINGQGFSSFSSACSYTENQVMTNLDFVQSTRSIFQARFFWMNSNENVTFNGGNTPGFPLTAPNKFRVGSFSHTYTFSPQVVNQAIFGVNSTNVHESATGPLSWTSLGYPNPPEGAGLFGLQITNSFSVKSPFEQATTQLDFNFVDVLSYTIGNHSLRFGGGLTREHLNPGPPIVGNSVIFPSFPDFLLGLSGCPPGTFPVACNPGMPGTSNGTPLSNELVSIGFDTAGERQFRAWNYNAFVQDDWKALKTLTLNFGLRYEHFGDFSDALGRLAGFNVAAADTNPPASGSLAGFYVNNNYPGTLPAGVVRLPNDASDNGKHRDTFAPRAGFAWQAFPAVVVRGGYGLYYSTPVAFDLFNSGNSEPWANSEILAGPANAAANWNNPFPVAVLPPSSFPQFLPYSATTNYSIQDQSLYYRPALTQVYDFNTQTSLSKNFLLEVGYTGARATHLFQGEQENYALFASPANPVRGATTNTVGNIAQRIRIPGFGAGGITQYGSDGASWYNALDVTLSKRFSHGLQFSAAYTWSKLLDTSALTTGMPATLVGNPMDLGRDYGPALYDRRNRFVISYAYDFPQAKANTAVDNILLNGWQLAGVTVVQSGTPLTPQVTNANNYSGITSDIAQVVPGCNLATPGRVQDKLTDYFNNACIAPFPIVDPSGATGFGNGPVGAVTGPGQANFDVTVKKLTRVSFGSENVNLEFRTEFFNLFNHTQFSNPIVTASAPTSLAGFGSITSTSVNPRVIQFALKLNF